MRRTLTCLFAFLALASILFADEPKKAEQKSPEDIVTAGILQFRERMRSDDAEVRAKEFDAVMPDKKTLERLFGDDANLIWPRFSEGMRRMRASSDKGKAEFDRQGKIVTIELIDVRQEDVSGRYRRVLQLIPKDIPVYRAITKYENGSGGSSSYLVIDGRMRFVPGLEGMADIIDRQNKSQKEK